MRKKSHGHYYWKEIRKGGTNDIKHVTHHCGKKHITFVSLVYKDTVWRSYNYPFRWRLRRKAYKKGYWVKLSS